MNISAKMTFTALLLCVGMAWGQNSKKVNYDESKVPSYTLPDVLRCNDGRTVTTARQWERQRRPEVLDLLSQEEYGITPRQKIKVSHQVLYENKQALGGKATMQQVQFTFSGQGKSVRALLLVYFPNQRKGRVPVFIHYNFRGNHSTCMDEDILMSDWFKSLPPDNPTLPRGNQMSRYNFDRMIERGYATATMCYQDIFPDHAEGGPKSVTALFHPKHNQGPHRWQAIGAWAWGYSRIADWVERQPWADRRQLIVMGHSRLGKTALWAGAQDKRFSVVISNNSGCGGAALSKREFGERVYQINKTFPHWFCPSFAQYGWKEQTLPFDQHELLALVAPRHLYVASAEKDNWADQRGEFLAAYHASPVWRLYGLEGLPSSAMPGLHQPIMNHVGYHIRAGIHDVTNYDWERYMDFCDKAFG